MNIFDLQDPVERLHGVGEKTLPRLHRRGMKTIADVLKTLPRDYDDLTKTSPIAEIRGNQKVTIRGKMQQLHTRYGTRRHLPITEAMVSDDTGSIACIWFHQPYLTQTLHKGDMVVLSGLAKLTRYGLALQSPTFEKMNTRTSPLHSGRIVPRYDLTEGLTQKQMRYFVHQAVPSAAQMADPFPDFFRAQYHLIPIAAAVSAIHFPASAKALHNARRRFDFEQLFFTHLISQKIRRELQTSTAKAQPIQEKAIQHFVGGLPFRLTEAQRKCAWAILHDTARSVPMSRLLVGDVGSGKTIVAAIAILNTVRNGRQVFLMAPTDILARQHAQTLQAIFASHNIHVVLHTSSAPTPDNERVAADVLVGTHALLQEHVILPRLALAIVDEQHRFGVAQRKTLRERSGNMKCLPHLLSMTATPIPRTLALTLYGDLDLTIIDEMPTGRKPITTRVVPPEKRPAAEQFIRDHLGRGEQCFVICPLIDPSDLLGVTSVSEEYERLRTIFPDARLAMLHGKMKAAEKEMIMQKMRTKTMQLLVATSVIEVGIDIPDATIMVIEDAERFGLAQLHQMRGRVGRSDKQSYCLLFTKSCDERVLRRLQMVVTSRNGFDLAQRDLELRGAGELFGTQQSGFFEIAQLAFDHPHLVEETQEAARHAITEGLLERHPLLQQKFEEFSHRLHWE